MSITSNRQPLFTNELLQEITKRNKTELCNMMTKYGSDKGTQHHNYTLLYDHIFNELRDKQINLLEIGIGSNNIHIPSNMSGISGYRPGASIRAWKEYFPEGKMYACDIDKDIVDFPDNRITGFYIDQKNIPELYSTFYENDLKDIEFDIIIDDGLHHFETNINVMHTLLPKLKKGGWYFIEDIVDYNHNLVPFGIPYRSQYVKLHNPYNNIDNNLYIVKK